jgi:RHS repeat-associated protein
MKFTLLLIVPLLFAALPCRGQSLADVLSSIQERKRAVEQSVQVADHLPSVKGQSVTILPQTLIEWTGPGITEFPASQQVVALGIDDKVALLNQAVMEFRNLRGFYVNLRKEDLDGSGRIGAIRAFQPDDFPDHGRADASNFHALLFALARDVRRLEVLPWPIGGKQRRMNYWLHNEEIEVFEDNMMVDIAPIRAGTETVEDWQPSSLGGGSVVSNDDNWYFTSAGESGAWGSFLHEHVRYYAYSDIDHEEDPEYGAYDLRILKVEKDTVFHTEAALFSEVPGRDDQIGGKIAVALRNEWSPVDMAKVPVTAPNSWDPADAGFKIILSQLDASSTYPLGADPDISIDLEWVTLGRSDQYRTLTDGVAYGLQDTKTWLMGPANANDPAWLVSWEKQQGIGPVDIASLDYINLLRRQLHGLCAPAFEMGLDGPGKPANLELAGKFSAPPAGDGKPLLHPSPGVLLGIPAGVGLDGSTMGFVGFSPCERAAVSRHGILYPRMSPQRLATRFDYAANLRFIGPARDFHVVYATSRESAARGEGLPDDGPTVAQKEATGNVEFFDAWDAPRLRQVVSRDLVINLTPLGHFKTEVKVYRRPQGATAVDREPGKIAPAPEGTPIRTLIFENPDAANEPYLSGAEKVRVTDGTTLYEIWRDGYPDDSDDPDPGISFKMTDGGTVRLSKIISFPAVGGAAINTQIDGNAASAETITDDNWLWHDGIVPTGHSITSGGQTVSTANIFTAETPGSQDMRYPSSAVVTISDEPNLSIAWHTSGRLASVSQGAWSVIWNIDGDDLKGETKLNGSRVGTTWTTWTNGTRTVRVTAAPDGATALKDAPTNHWSEIEYGDASGTGMPGLPHKLTRKHDTGNENGALWTWTVNAGGATTVEIADGLISGASVTRGTKSVIETNGNGYVTASRTYLLQGGPPLQIAGSKTPDGQFTTWGAPKAAEDFNTKLTSSWAFDGQRERHGTATDYLGNTSNYNSYDALERPTGFSWKGHTGSATYNSGGFGVTTSLNVGGRTVGQSLTWDAAGRTTGGSVTSGGVRGFGIQHTASNKTITSTDSVTGASSSATISTADGSLEEQTGTRLAFGGLDGTSLEVEDGLLKSTTTLGDLAASFRTTWTDAWGRIRKTTTAGTAGGSDLTQIFHNPPASTTKRIEIRHASGRRWIEETEPWASDGIITRAGVDKNENGSLGAGDRYVTTTSAVVGSLIRTTIIQTGNPVDLMVRDYNPSNGVTITTLNGGEDEFTETPDFNAKTSKIIHKRDGVTVSTKDITLNHLGQIDLTTVSGPGMPAINLNPTMRDDGSLEEFSVTIGGAEAKATFAQNGTLSGFTHPLLGNLTVNHGFNSGVETLTVDGTTSSRKLDGTASSLTGAGVMARGRSTDIAGGNFEHTITPATGSPTTLVANAAGAKVLHQYAAGANPITSWLPGGLLNSVSLGRGGAVIYGYSNDGAKDLVSITWPEVTSAGFPNETFYGGEIGFTQRDDAGNITALTDPAGGRSLAYEKNRLTTTDWLSGELDAYKIVREPDDQGRPDKVTLFRNETPIHAIDRGFTGPGDEISGVTSNGFTASVTRDQTSRHITGFTRGGVTQTWGRGTAGRITSAGSNVSGAPSFAYNSFDPKGRRQTVNTNKGNWTYAYRGGDNGDGQLVSATSTGNNLGNFAYDFDAIGRRDFGNNQQDELNRFLAIVHPTTPKKLFITADPDARLWINGSEMTPFNGGHIHPLAHPGTSGGWVPWTVKGVLEGAGDEGAFEHAVAELSGNVWFPPTSENFTFDADGNRESSSLWHYGWNGRNQLVRARTKTWASAPQGWDVKFDYDAEGRRFKKEITRYEDGDIAGQKVVYFIWDGWDLLYERHQDAQGNLLLDRKYIWGPDIADGAAGGAGGLLLIREKRGTTTNDYHPLFDGSGHVTGLTDSSGNLVAEYWHGPFGELIEAQGEMADANPFRYATKYYDTETGLYYFGHRYYDPVSGQWMNREPLGEDESLNLYSYCHNDPVNKVDVLGLFVTQVQVDEVRMTVLLGMLSRDPSKLPTEFPQELANMNYLPNAEKFGLLKPFGAEDYQRAYTHVKSAGQPSMSNIGWEEAQAANSPSFRNQEWIPHITRSQNLGAANTPLLAQINSDFLLPTGAGSLGLKVAFGGLKTALPVLAAGAHVETRLLSAEVRTVESLSTMSVAKTAPITDPARLLATRGSNPDLPGSPIFGVELPTGYRFNQAVGPGQTSPGAFGTLDNIPSVDFVRNNLAVIPEFKPIVSGVRQVEVLRPVRAQFSRIGPQIADGVTYPGAGWQVRILGYDRNNPFVRFVGDEIPLK